MSYQRPFPHRFSRGAITCLWEDPIGGPFSSLVVEQRHGPHVWRRTVGPADLLTVPEAALAMKGADRTTLYRLIRDGRIRPTELDGVLWVRRSQVDRYLAAVANQGRGRKLGQRWREG